MGGWHRQALEQRLDPLFEQAASATSDVDSARADQQRRGHTAEAGLLEQSGHFREAVFFQVQASVRGGQKSPVMSEGRSSQLGVLVTSAPPGITNLWIFRK